MKRFTIRKIAARILALVMLFSYLPVDTLASVITVNDSTMLLVDSSDGVQIPGADSIVRTLENSNVRMTGDKWALSTLAPGASMTYETKPYTVTSDDVKNQYVTNTATASDIDLLTNSHLDPLTANITVPADKIKLEITANSDKKVYDGTELVNDMWSQTGGQLLNGHRIIEMKVTGSQKLVGESENVPQDAKIWDYDNNKDVTESYDITYKSGKLTVTDGENPGDKPVPDDLVVTKTQREDRIYEAGDVVVFDIAATNIYDKARTITFREIEGVVLSMAKYENVAPGATVGTVATYTLTEADIARGKGKYTNTVWASIDKLEKKAQATLKIKQIIPALSLVKTVTSKPSNGGAYVLGEKIDYSILVENTGNMEIHSIIVSDKVTGNAWEINAMEPGDSKTFTTSYIVTGEDVKAGKVLIVTTAVGFDPRDEPVEPEPDEEEVPTGKIALEITTASDRKVYDGTPLTNNGWKLTGGSLVEGNTLTAVTVTGRQTLVGTSKNTAGNAKITDTKGIDESDCYSITYVPGTLNVTDGTDPDEEDVPDELVVLKDDNSEQAYEVGETVAWTITVTNIYDEEKTLTVTEAKGMSLVGNVPATLAAGEAVELTAQHVVTAEDAEKGSITNIVTARLGDLEKEGEDTVPVTPKHEPKPEQTLIFAESTVEKTYGDDDFTNVLSGAKTGVTYKSGDESVATVDGSGKVHIIGSGKMIITAVAEETAEYAETKATYTLMVKKAAPNVNAPAMKENLICDSSAQALIYAGSVTGGTLYYAVTTGPTAPADDKYDTAIPTATDAGIYYVWFKAFGDADHVDSAAAYVTATIAKAPEPPVPKDKKINGEVGTKGKNKLALKWAAVNGAEGYELFFTECGSELKHYKTVKPDVTEWTFKKLDVGTPYKMQVKAYVMQDGEKKYIGHTDTLHCITNGSNGHYTNAVKIKAKDQTIAEGEKKQLKVTLKGEEKGLPILPHGGAVRYESMNPDIATVDKDGNVKGVSTGSCKILLSTADGLRKTIVLTVKAGPEELRFGKKKYKVEVGKTLNLKKKLKISPSDAEVSLKWKSSDKSIAKVDKNGKVTGRKKGTVKITVTASNGVTVTVKVKVK